MKHQVYRFNAAYIRQPATFNVIELPNSYPNACVPMQGGSLYHFYGLWCDPAERRTITLNVASCRLEATFNRSTWCCLSQVLERVDRKEHQPSCKISASCSDMTHSIHELDIFYSLNHPVLFFQFAKYFSYRHLKSPLSTFKRFRAAILLVYLVTWHRRFYNWNVLREGRWKRIKQIHTYKSVAVYSVFHLSSQNTFQL